MERWPRIAAVGVGRLSHLRKLPTLLRDVTTRLRRLPRPVKAGAAGAVMVLLVIASILFIRNPAGPFGRIEPLPPTDGTVTRMPVLGPGHRFLFFPVSGRVTPGVKYRFVLLTHCGLDYPTGPDFDGSFWDLADSAGRNTFTSTPPGFAQPEDQGYMILVSTDTAEFHSSAGGVARYTRRTKALIAGLCH
jgi:hypothetical protein